MKRFIKYLNFVVVAAALLVSCQKNNLVIDQDVTPPSFVKFNNILPGDTTYSYYITPSSPPVVLPVGVTTVSNQDRTIQVTYTSSGAVQGTQFSAPSTITIPAGQTIANLEIQGLVAGYASSTKIDTLIIQVGGGDVPSSDYRSKYRLIMRKYCDVVIDDFLGDYDNTTELFGTSAYGPYTTSISSVTPVSATKARIVVENIYDYGWGPIKFELDWTDPANFKATVVAQDAGIADAGTLGAAYAGEEVAVRPSSQAGTFSSCEGTLILRMQIGVAGLGYFSDLYQLTMKR